MKLTHEVIERHVNRDKHSLDLSGSLSARRSFSNNDIQLLCHYLHENPEISILFLSDSKILLQGVKELAANTTLTTLDLDGNNFGDEEVKVLAVNTTLTDLDLKNNNINDEGIKFIAANTTLTSLDVSLNNVGDEGVKALAINTTLTVLGLSWNNISSEGAKWLAANSSITSLNIGLNNIGDVGARALASNTTLTTLNVVCNDIHDEGASSLALSTTLTMLELGSNDISAVGAKALADNTTLKMLDISDSSIGAAGALSLMANTTLTNLNVKRNSIDDEVAAFVSAIKNNMTLETLCHNFTDKHVNETIEKLLIRNKVMHSYPQQIKLILAAYAENKLFESLHSITPLSLGTLCGLKIIKIAEQQFSQQQNNIFKGFETLIPEEVFSLLVNLRSLKKEVMASLKIDSLPHFGVVELLTISESKCKMHRI